MLNIYKKTNGLISMADITLKLRKIKRKEYLKYVLVSLNSIEKMLTKLALDFYI